MRAGSRFWRGQPCWVRPRCPAAACPGGLAEPLHTDVIQRWKARFEGGWGARQWARLNVAEQSQQVQVPENGAQRGRRRRELRCGQNAGVTFIHGPGSGSQITERAKHCPVRSSSGLPDFAAAPIPQGARGISDDPLNWPKRSKSASGSFLWLTGLSAVPCSGRLEGRKCVPARRVTLLVIGAPREPCWRARCCWKKRRRSRCAGGDFAAARIQRRCVLEADDVFKQSGTGKEFCLTTGRGHHLQAHWQPLRREAARQ